MEPPVSYDSLPVPQYAFLGNRDSISLEIQLRTLFTRIGPLGLGVNSHSSDSTPAAKP